LPNTGKSDGLSVEFSTSISINGVEEELVFISWDDYTITHFIIIGYHEPLYMAYKPMENRWEFIDKELNPLRDFELTFSDLINEHLKDSGQ
jgi:hypothetical protein